MKLSDLEKYCAPKDNEHYAKLGKPFLAGEYVLAGDGVLMVVVHRSRIVWDAPSPKPANDEQRVIYEKLLDFSAQSRLVDGFFKMPDDLDSAISERPCGDCRGEGLLEFKSPNGQVYVVNCDWCDGEGTETVYKPSCYRIGSLFIATQQLARIRDLPNPNEIRLWTTDKHIIGTFGTGKWFVVAPYNEVFSTHRLEKV
jgi:hypothetical protein